MPRWYGHAGEIRNQQDAAGYRGYQWGRYDHRGCGNQTDAAAGRVYRGADGR